jgi:hypothetical protein
LEKDWKWESTNHLEHFNSPDWATNPYGTYFLAQWDLEITTYYQARMDEEGETMAEENVSPHALVHLDRDLSSLRDSIEQYYIEYAGQGCIEEDLQLRASSGDWECVQPMNARF